MPIEKEQKGGNVHSEGRRRDVSDSELQNLEDTARLFSELAAVFTDLGRCERWLHIAGEEGECEREAGEEVERKGRGREGMTATLAERRPLASLQLAAL